MPDGKVFEPTRSRLQRARREGDVPRVNELVGVAALIGAAGCFFAGAPFGARAAAGAIIASARGAPDYIDMSFLLVWALAVPLVGGIAGAVAAIALGGGLRTVPITANFGRLSPLNGLRRIASRDSLLAAIRAAVAATVVTSAVAPAFRDAFRSSVGPATAQSLTATAWQGARRSLWAAICVGFAVAFLDMLTERFKWRRRLRMTFDEMKRDLRQNEGDPLIRGRRRARHRELSTSALARVREAAFVLTNPTHVAVALAYRPPEISVPKVVVRALDDLAQAVRERARELAIPILEQPLLARSLFESTEVDAYITRSHYVAVAQIVAFLLRDGVLE